MEFASEFIFINFDKKDEFYFDTNVMNVNMIDLLENQKKNIMTGDPILCKKCNIVLSKFSKTTNSENLIEEEFKKNEKIEVKKIWECDFCGFKNAISIEPEEIPKEEETFYILQKKMVLIYYKFCCYN